MFKFIKNLLDKFAKINYEQQGIVICIDNINDLNAFRMTYPTRFGFYEYHQIFMNIYSWNGSIYFWLYKDEIKLVAYTRPDKTKHLLEECPYDHFIRYDEWKLLQDLSE